VSGGTTRRGEASIRGAVAPAECQNTTSIVAVSSGVVRYSSKPGSGGTTTYPGGVVIIEHTLPDGTV